MSTITPQTEETGYHPETLLYMRVGIFACVGYMLTALIFGNSNLNEFLRAQYGSSINSIVSEQTFNLLELILGIPMLFGFARYGFALVYKKWLADLWGEVTKAQKGLISAIFGSAFLVGLIVYYPMQILIYYLVLIVKK